MKRIARITLYALGSLLLITLAPVAAQDAPPPITITLAAYSTPREAYGDIIPLFQAKWQEETGQQVIVLESYQGSGGQSRAIAGGFEADVAALSIEPDISRLVEAGLITHDWKDTDYQGFVTNSLVVLAVRPDNPRSIADWADLTQEGLQVITPDPATSGGAQWNILAAWGAVLHGYVQGYEATEDGATEFLRGLITNIAVLDRDARDSFLTFERGIGDVAITYENEVYSGLLVGGQYQIVYPTSTILIQTPVAVIDGYVDAHGTREVAEAFVDFLWSSEAQLVFANHGYRPLNAEVAAHFQAEAAETPESSEFVITFPSVEDLFTVDDLDGWAEARPKLFGNDGLFTTLIAEVQGQ